ncbi:MAG TPA: aspartyl/asparaginyl beta-hydroxylase domain-containing protein [Planctomycetota bacterium]
MPQVRGLESQWLEIRAEMEALPAGSFKPWPQHDHRFMSGVLLSHYGRDLPVAARCPRTMAALRKLPNFVNAGFQSVAAGGHLLPHHGSTAGILRGLLPLTMSADGDNWIKVAGQKHVYREGEVFLLLDTSLHEVRNESSVSRTVLAFDLWLPMRVPGDRLRRIKHRIAARFLRKRSAVMEFKKQHYEDGDGRAPDDR